MMPVRHRRCLAPTLLALACALVPLNAVEPAVTEPAPAQGPEVSVTIGGISHAYVLALDDLRGLADGSQATAVKALAKMASRPVSALGVTKSGLARTSLIGIRTIAELQQVANQLVDARAIQYPEAVIIPAGANSDDRQILTRFIGVRLGAGSPSIDVIAHRHGLTVVRESIPGSWLLEVPGENLLRALDASAALANEPGVSVAPLIRKQLKSNYTPTDPVYTQPIQPHYAGLWPYFPALAPDYGQWHLHNAPRGMNCEPVWDLYQGVGINVAVLDQGMEYTHPDLGVYPNGNVRWDMAWDFIGTLGKEDATPLPTGTEDNHATCVAGCIAAREGNGIGGVGAAFKSHVIPLKILGDETVDVGNTGVLNVNVSDEQLARAFTWGMRGTFSSNDIVHISNNSWGPGSMAYLGGYDDIFTMPALQSAISTGRANRGVVFCFAAGNEHGFYGSRYPRDNANYDGFLNRYIVSVGALNRGGRKSSYSSIGSNLLVSAPGGDFNLTPWGTTSAQRCTDTTQSKPMFWPGGILTTDRTRAYSQSSGVPGTGYFPGEWDRDGDDTDSSGQIRPGSQPDVQEDLEFWGRWGDGKQDLVNEANPSKHGFWVPAMDLDGDGWPDTGEDRNLDFTLQLTEDLDGDGHFDVWSTIDPVTKHPFVSEDRNYNGILDPGEDLDGDGHMDWYEDLDLDGHFDNVTEVDTNLNGYLDPSEDLDHDGNWDRGEDWNGDGALELTEDLNGDGNFDELGEDVNRNRQWDGGDYTEINLIPYGGPAWSPSIPQDLVGTSFACPNTAGVIALMLQARPTLTWRDVQHILALRSRKPLNAPLTWVPHTSPFKTLNVLPGNITSTSYSFPLDFDRWVLNDAGMTHDLWYGFGAIQAARSVFGGDGSSSNPAVNSSMAANPGVLAWPMMPVEATPITATFVRNQYVASSPEDGHIFDDSLIPRLEIPFQLVAPADFHVESVELKIDVTHSRRGDLSFGLVSDAGTVGEVPARIEDTTKDLHHTFTFRTFWNETVGKTPSTGTNQIVGNWKLIVVDDQPGNIGQVDKAVLTIHGYQPYPVPTVSSHNPSGIAVGRSTDITVTGAGFRRNASSEITATTAIWKDHDPAGTAIGELTCAHRTDSELHIIADGSGLESISPGIADITVANPALVIGQTTLPGPLPDFLATGVHPEDRYARSDVWESGPDRWDVTPTSTGLERRLKRDAANPVSFQCRYSRPPVITPIPDYILPAGTKEGTLTVTFNVYDPDSDPAKMNPGKVAETLTVDRFIYNTAIVDPTSVSLTEAGLNANGSIDYNLTFKYTPNNGGSNVSVIQVSATDTAVTTNATFRVGVQSAQDPGSPSGCGGGGLALVGMPLGLWLLLRRRR